MTQRVLHVVEAIEGGVARHVLDLVRLVSAEHVVAMPAERFGGVTDHGAIAAMRASGARVDVVEMRRNPVDKKNVVAIARINRLVREFSPDVIHGHASIGGAVARLAAWPKATRTVYTPNGILPARGSVLAERLLRRLTDAFVAVSPTEAALALKMGLASENQVVVIPNGIDLSPPESAVVDVRAALDMHDDAPLIGTISRLAPQKAPEVFVRACELVAATVPDARFLLVGDGPLASEFHAEVRRAGLEGRLLHLPNVVSAASLLDQLDVFVLASRYEGAPYTALEAMRSSVPVVLTDVVGNRDAVEHDRSGILVPPGDPDALARAILRLLGDSELRRKLGQSGHDRVVARFDVRQMAERVAALYRSISRG